MEVSCVGRGEARSLTRPCRGSESSRRALSTSSPTHGPGRHPLRLHRPKPSSFQTRHNRPAESLLLGCRRAGFSSSSRFPAPVSHAEGPAAETARRVTSIGLLGRPREMSGKHRGRAPRASARSRRSARPRRPAFFFSGTRLLRPAALQLRRSTRRHGRAQGRDGAEEARARGGGGGGGRRRRRTQVGEAR